MFILGIIKSNSLKNLLDFSIIIIFLATDCETTLSFHNSRRMGILLLYFKLFHYYIKSELWIGNCILDIVDYKL